ncbi:MAG TPA: Ig-like domain-containing protein [Candidatus Saccharimonadales bacterium]|nr:Ig-like domain-containing protein [Candidatus Saccharimonadales bacterium]
MQDTGVKYKNVKVAIAIILVAVVGWLSYVAYLGAMFRLVSTSPATSNFSVSSPAFKVTFSQDISEHGIAVVSDPMVIRNTTVSGKTLTINLITPLDKTKTYTITINNVTSKSGKTITNKKFTFQPKEIDFNSLPKDQQQTILNSQKPSQQAETDPMLSHLPYSTLDFRLDPVTSTDANGKLTLTIQAQIYVLPNSSTSETDQIAQAKQEIATYFKQFGLDVSTYNVQYQTVVQTLQGT